MKKYDVENIRTIAVMGHHGSGKTSFMESVLYVTGSKKKKGSVDDKNTTSDYLLEEKEHQASLSMSLIPKSRCCYCIIMDGIYEFKIIRKNLS